MSFKAFGAYLHQTLFKAEQADNILKLLDRIHRPDYDEEFQDEELLDWMTDFVVVLLDYVKILKRRRNIFRKMIENSSSL